MVPDPIFRRYSEYRHRRWYPAKYEDPFGDFVDDIAEETFGHLKRALPGSAAAALMLILLELLPGRRYPDLAKEAARVYRQTLDGAVKPSAAFYYLRALPAQERTRLWQSWKEWARQSQVPLQEWLSERIALHQKLADVRKHALSQFGIDTAAESAGLERLLRSSRDIFDFEFRRYATGRTLADVLSAFRMPMCDALADWNDFQAFARNWSEECRIASLPSLKHSVEEPAQQQVLPVNPPSRVELRYGTAAGPVDSLRFVQELGRASFYCGMDSELSSTDRLLGDPMLPHFWAGLYAEPLTQPAGIAKLIRIGSEDLAPRLRLVLRFWNRYDCLLAVYHERLASDLKEAQDLYVACWEISYSFEPPHFLFLHDLERSGDALLRACASRSAAAVAERLRSLYGNDWFASERCARRLRDYRYEGYRLKVEDILRDLDAGTGDNFLIPSY